MENPLPKDLNKIIETYCYYPLKFEKELLHKIRKIHEKVAEYFFYTRNLNHYNNGRLYKYFIPERCYYHLTKTENKVWWRIVINDLD